jgi:hypothetical protein
MGRLSIEITKQQHQQIKAIAALQGMSIKDYILQAVLSQAPTSPTLPPQQLEDGIEYITAIAPENEPAPKTIYDILADAKARTKFEE